MVGVEDEQQVEDAADLVVDGVLLGGHAEEGLQEVGGVAQRGVGVDEGLVLRVLVAPGGEHRELREDAVRGELDLRGDVGVVGVVVEGRERVDRGAQHRHRVRVTGEGAVEVLEVFGHQRLRGDAGLEGRELRRRGELPVEQEVRDLDEGRLLRELLDGVAAVAQDALLAVEEGDRAGGGGGVQEAGVERHEAGAGPQLRDVDPALLLRSHGERELQGLAVVVQGDVRHRTIPLKRCGCGVGSGRIRKALRRSMGFRTRHFKRSTGMRQDAARGATDASPLSRGCCWRRPGRSRTPGWCQAPTRLGRAPRWSPGRAAPRRWCCGGSR